MDMEILPDGSIKITVNGTVSMPNHKSAEQVLEGVAQLAGGATEIIGKKGHHTHEQVEKVSQKGGA